jgi:hypothetical protein
MTLTNRFASGSIKRTVMIAVLAMTLAGGALIRLAATEGHAANIIGSVQIAEPGATCLVGNPKYLEVHSPTLVAYDRPQYVEWWVELLDNGTGKVVQGWTFVQGISVDPNAASKGVTIPGEVYLTVPSPNYVHARIGVNWFDPSNQYAFETQTLVDVKYYLQQVGYADPTLSTGC